MEKLGIEEIKPVVGVSIKLGQIFSKLSQEKFAGPALVQAALAVVPLVPQIAAIKYGAVIPEFKDLSVEEAKQLADHVDSEMGVAGVDEDAQERVNKILDAAIKGYVVVSQVLEILKEFKKPASAPSA